MAVMKAVTQIWRAAYLRNVTVVLKSSNLFSYTGFLDILSHKNMSGVWNGIHMTLLLYTLLFLFMFTICIYDIKVCEEWYTVQFDVYDAFIYSADNPIQL